MSAWTSRYVRMLLTPCGRAPEDWRPITLRMTARHLLEVLSSYAAEAEAWPSVDTLAERMGTTPATVRRARAELVAAGVITVDAGGGRTPNRYRFPVASPLEVVHTPRADARAEPSTPRAPARGDPARQRARKYQ